MFNNNQRDSHVRSILKSVSWRVLATLTTIVISYIVTQDIDIALAIGGIEFFAKIIIYYLHERIWIYFPVKSC